MKPHYVFQLPQEEQDRLREKIRFVLLHGCMNDPALVSKHYGDSLDVLVQAGMDSKISDLDEIHRLFDEIMEESREDTEDEWER